MASLRGTRTLVTGATGFLGMAVVHALAEAHCDVHVLVRARVDPTTRRALRKLARCHTGDLAVNKSITAVVRAARPDAIVHLAAAGVRTPFMPVRPTIRANVTGTVNLLEAAGPACRVLIARTPGEAGAMNPYSASKAAAWQYALMYLRTRGYKIAGAMPFHVYGATQPSGQFIPQALRAAVAGIDFPMTHGTQVRDWIHVDDLADGMVAALERAAFAGETLELGTGVGTSLRTVVEMLYAAAARGGRPLPGAIAARPGEIPVMLANADATAERTGWRARITLRAGLQRTVQAALVP